MVENPLSALDLKFVWELLWKRRILTSIEPANFEKQWLRLEENHLWNNLAEQCVPFRGLRIDLQGETFGVKIAELGFGGRMFGPVDRSGGHESVRILRQNYSLGCFLQA